MIARPILMHARSVQNLLAGRKTQTRRIVKPQPNVVQQLAVRSGCTSILTNLIFRGADQWVRCPYGQPGDLLWVRERFALNEPIKSSARGWDAHWTVGVEYSDGYEVPQRFEKKPARCRNRGEVGGWQPSIHMPRRLSRLTLRLTDVRVERVQDCSEADALAEGVQPVAAVATLGGQVVGGGGWSSREMFAALWNDTNGSGAWERNDWCWVLQFEVLRQNVDRVLERAKALGQ